jgi:two-component system repressor protein LuxO
VFNLPLPALRDRKVDIPKLSTYFIEIYTKLDNHPVYKSISQAALKTLQEYSWPGNIRELENVIRQSLITSVEDTLYAEDFAKLLNLVHSNVSHDAAAVVEVPHKYPDGPVISILSSDGELKTLEALEQEILMHSLKHNKYNVTKTSKALGIAKSTFYRKIDKIDD